MRARRQPEPADLITIAEAARPHGVSLPTMRRWDESGNFPARRHPINSCRMHTRDEVMKLRGKTVDGERAA